MELIIPILLKQFQSSICMQQFVVVFYNWERREKTETLQGGTLGMYSQLYGIVLAFS